MLKFTDFQSVFNENNTELRCRKVLDEVSPVVKPIFEHFVKKTGVSLGDEYVVKSYDTTLATTYSDARNPRYADKKKTSTIGRKYFVGLYRKVNDKEYNLMMLEFNGENNALSFHIELGLIPFWAWVKNDQMNSILNAIPSSCSIFTGRNEKTTIPKDEFVSYVKSCIKSRKRPSFQIGISQPLNGVLDEAVLLEQLLTTWNELEGFRDLYMKEMDISKRAFDALMILAVPRNTIETKLLGREYTIEISSLENHTVATKRQMIQLFDESQLITKGFIYYMEYDDKNSPLQIISVKLEGHSHIFTSSREVLGTGVKKWWITKLFATHDLDNKKVMANAMQLLVEHGIETNGSEYLVGSFDNEANSFVEGAEEVKKNFINAALLFAHASEKLALPRDDEDDEVGVIEEFDPNFQFSAIYHTISTSQFTFSQAIIRDLHLNLTALDDKHFVLLSGISGTGKTQLCRLYANAVYGLDYESDHPYFTIIPVRPDWTDASALFGYYSSFEKRYVKTEFLTVLLNALKEREKPHFILLDEMNLARVEYYLSDYLSAVESRKEIHLHQNDEITEIPKKLIIPPNVYLFGTINVDETTHSISDKVLDRAFVMTLSDVDFDAFWERADQDLKTALDLEFQLLKELHQILARFELHFGYRTMEEVLKKLYANRQLPEEFQMDPLEALDRTIAEKVFTKIRGDERISEMLEIIEAWLLKNLIATSISHTHLKRMQEELEYYGATQFWR